MLSKLFSKDFCAKCGFCCIFKVCHLWETPLFSAEDIEGIKDCTFFESDTDNGKCYSFVSESDLKKQPEEEVPCPFLNKDTGCTLDEKTKPLECKIWPYRIMKKDGKTILAVSKECPGISKYDIEYLKEFAKQNLVHEILAFIENHHYIVKEYRDNYHELFEL